MTPESTSLQETPTENAVVDQLESLFAAEDSGTADSEAASAEQALSNAAEQVADSEPAEATDDTPESENAEEDGDEETPAAPVLVTVKVDGKDVQLPLDEALKGYSRTADYTRKTQAHAEEVRKFQAEQTVIREARTRYDQGLAQVEAALKELQGEEPDWEAFRASGQYTNEQINTAYINFQRQKGQLDRIRAEREGIARQQLAEQAENHRKHVAAERERLFEALPDLKDDTKGTALRAKMQAFAESRGYSIDDLNSTADHRGLVLLHDAMLYHELLAKQQQVSKKVDEQITRVAQPGAGKKGRPAPPDRLARAKAQLANTGSEEDAVEMLLAIEASQK